MIAYMIILHIAIVAVVHCWYKEWIIRVYYEAMTEEMRHRYITKHGQYNKQSFDYIFNKSRN